MTEKRTTADAFGDAAAAMVSEHSVADVLAQLLADSVQLLSAQSVAILVVDRAGELSLLSSSSHRVAELEALQAQREVGPCVDAIRTGTPVIAVGGEELAQRWGQVGEAIAGAGFDRVDAYPMRWHDRVLGGLNIFRRSTDEVDAGDARLSQSFADVATLVVVQSTEIPADQVAARVHEAITARSQVEQAKGVLAYLRDLDMPAAYEELLQLARDRGRTLTETARDVVREQYESR
jgi:hypothetical protein